MVVIMDVHAEEPFMDRFPERKHGFLGPAADKDLGILANGNIGPVVGRTDVVSNGLGPLVHNILVRGQYRRISHSTENQQSGDDGSYGRLTKIPPVYICTYKFTLTGRFVLTFR